MLGHESGAVVLKNRLENGESGFSLIELMIALAILALALALGMPGYKTWVQNTQIRNAAESVLNGLQVARMEAVQRNHGVKFELAAGSGWKVSCEPVDAVCADDPIQERSASEGSSGSIDVAPAGVVIIFNQLGGSDGVYALDIDSSAVAASEQRPLRVTVDVGGNTRMCDPESSLDASDPRKC